LTLLAVVSAILIVVGRVNRDLWWGNWIAVAAACNELRVAWERLATEEGVFCEPASAAALAGLGAAGDLAGSRAARQVGSPERINIVEAYAARAGSAAATATTMTPSRIDDSPS